MKFIGIEKRNFIGYYDIIKMEEFILLDEFTKDMFSINEHGLILMLLGEDRAMDKKTYGAFITLFEKHDIGYQLLRKEGEDIFQFKIVNYTLWELLSLLPYLKEVAPNSENDYNKTDNYLFLIPCQPNKKDSIDYTQKYRAYWSEEHGLYRPYMSGTSGMSGTTGTAGTSGVPTNPGKLLKNGITGSISGSYGSSGAFGTSGSELNADLTILQRLLKFLKIPIITAKQLNDG